MLDEKAASKSRADIKNAFQTKPFFKASNCFGWTFCKYDTGGFIFLGFLLSGEKTLEPIIGSPNSDSVAMEKGFEDGMRINRIGKTEIQSWKDINRTPFEYIGHNGDIHLWVEKNSSLDESIISVDVQSWLQKLQSQCLQGN